MHRYRRLWIMLFVVDVAMFGAVAAGATALTAVRMASPVGDTGELRLTGTPTWFLGRRDMPRDTQAALRMIQRSVGLRGR
jgi:tripartite-type tricarboxylate transporter receptor subunit TctC